MLNESRLLTSTFSALGPKYGRPSRFHFSSLGRSRWMHMKATLFLVRAKQTAVCVLDTLSQRLHLFHGIMTSMIELDGQISRQHETDPGQFAPLLPSECPFTCYLPCSNLSRSGWFASYDLSSAEGQDAVAMPMNGLNHTCGPPHTNLWLFEHSQVAHEPQLRFSIRDPSREL